jgi:hypothetical protein
MYCTLHELIPSATTLRYVSNICDLMDGPGTGTVMVVPIVVFLI